MMLRFKSIQNFQRLLVRPQQTLQTNWSLRTSNRMFSSQQPSNVSELGDLEQQALNIQNSIDRAQINILQNTKKGKGLSLEISKEVKEDHFIKKQRYDIFITKMEQLQRAEKKDKKAMKKTVAKMQSAFVVSQQPLKDVLHYYNKAAVKGFDAALVSNTLEQIKLTLRARGNKPRAYDDYTTREFDLSWRMHVLSDHIKIGLSEETYFNHYHMSNSSKQLGEIGFKDTDLIQKYFNKLNFMLLERETNSPRSKKPLDIETVLYGNYLNTIPKHYVFDGFESSQEFNEYLKTLLDWQVEQKDGLAEMGIEATQNVQDLEVAMAQLISATHEVKDMQVGMQASIDSLRQQYFKLQEAKDKNTFLQDNKHVHYDMLELQELLVRGGYIEPEEAESMSASLPHEVRMDRAAQIFYEYVQNYAPDLISPQYEQFYSASQATLQNRYEQRNEISLDENHDKISLSSLSKSLTGLSHQALSYRREANDKDYLHQFYETQATAGEIRTGDKNAEISHMLEATTVKMGREYLKAYDIFHREVEQIWPRYEQVISQSADDLEGQLHCLLGMSKCKIEAPQIRSSMLKNISRLIDEGSPMRPEAIVDGLYGIALQHSPYNSRKVVSKLLHRLNANLSKGKGQLSFQQKLEVIWSACALGQEQNSVVQQLYSEINSMNFQRTDNDLTYDQFQLVRDFQLYLTKVSVVRNEAWVQEGRNQALDHLFLHPEMHNIRYEESSADFDPFKKRVLEGLTKGLTMASIDHQSTLESNLFDQKEQEVNFNDAQYPYKPDAIFGLNGQKVLLNVIPASETMRDIKKGDGKIQFRARITAGLHEGRNEVRSMAVPITSVINYDIENLKIEMNQNYNFQKDLYAQIQKGQKELDFDQLGAFGAAFTREATQYLSALKAPGDRKRVDVFFKQLYQVFQVKQQTERQYEQIIQKQGLDSLKIELMKLDLLYDSLPLHQKQYIQQFVQNGGSFKEMIVDVKNNIQHKIQQLQSNKDVEIVNKELDNQWFGTRLEVELPQSAKFKAKKNIVPEIINQRFMWVDDYFHYNDWEDSQKEVFDGFNLLVVPRQEAEFKYFYDRENNHRIVPQGIFPPPNHKRIVLQSGVESFASQTNEATRNGNDALNEFEKEPFKTMVLKEQQRSQKLAPISNDISFMTNLQNIKQGLKQDYSDKQILDLILSNMSFTDKLIEDHLKNDDKSKSPSYISRNPSNFREFVKSSYFSKDQEDPFTHFFIHESGKQERIHKTFNDQQQKYGEQFENAPTLKMKDGVKKIMNTLTTKIEDMMLQNKRENEDITSMSHQLKSEVKINYDMKSLMKSEFVYDIDPELIDPEIPDALYLRQQRKRAETKLIKTKIIYKMDQTQELSDSEKRYMKSWVQHLQANKDINIRNHRDTLVPNNNSSLDIGKALSAEDIFTLNQIPNVQIDRKQHGEYALNDLVLELSHFLDEEVVNRVEMEIMSDRLRKEWDLPQEFQIIETRNKEISITLNELEEVAWRMAGRYDDREINTLQAMFSINRNKDSFDKAFYDNDMQSMRDLIQNANVYDDRDKIIQEWFVRKEKEIKSRVVLPPKNMQKTDQELNRIIDSKLKLARQKMVTKFLITDEFGFGVVQKDYKDLTTGELSQISESISVRLNLFDGKYPAFMPQAVRAVMEHPSLAKADKQKLDTFSRMFELDWRGDREINNKNQFMATNPVYLAENDQSNFKNYGNIGNYEATTLLRLACAPFVEDIAQAMIVQGPKVKDQQKKLSSPNPESRPKRTSATKQNKPLPKSAQNTNKSEPTE